MKKIIANSRGVTLISLITMIIVLLILASIATYSGMQIIQSAKVTTFTTEMKIMQTQVNSLYEQWKNGNITIENGIITMKDDNGQEVTVGKDLDINDEVIEQTNKVLKTELEISDTTGYRYFDKETIEQLNIEGVKQEFFINLEKRDVVSYKGLKYEGDMYYTLLQLPQGLYNVEYEPDSSGQPTFDVSYEAISENKWRVTISNIQYNGYINKWYVRYQVDGADYWNSTEDMTFIITEKTNYKVYIYNGTVKSEEKDIELVAEEFTRQYGEIDIMFLSEKTNNVSNNANAPVLGANMTPINFDSSNNTWVEVSESNWEYSYNNEAGTSEWANAVLKDDEGNITGYFVWIPRYAYKITYYSDSNYTTVVGYSDARGIVTVNGGEYIGAGSRRKAGDNYIVHPTFTNDIEVGGWDSELEGVWVAKYEASSSNPSASNGGGNTTNLSVKVLPGITGWRNIGIGNIYTVSKNYSPDNNSHLMKNSEWGAVAYLSYSNYGIGKDSKISNANTTIRYYTGGSSTVSEIYTTNVSQSTTGNAYGIYDMNGNLYEYQAAYVNNGSLNLTHYGQALIDAGISGDTTEKRTVTVYEASNEGDSSTSDSQEDNYKLNGEKMFGDATYETSISHDNTGGSWQSTTSYYPYTTGPFFVRGSQYTNFPGHDSIFYVYGTNGAFGNVGFRPVLAF